MVCAADDLIYELTFGTERERDLVILYPVFASWTWRLAVILNIMSVINDDAKEIDTIWGGVMMVIGVVMTTLSFCRFVTWCYFYWNMDQYKFMKVRLLPTAAVIT